MPFPPKRIALAAVLLTGTALAGAAVPELLAPAWAEPVPTTQGIQPTPARNVPDFADLVSQVRPAVVSITATMHGGEGHATRPGRTGQAKGSGFIVTASGTVVTNNHVIRDADRVEVTLDDGTTLPARVVGRDPRTDLAVLKVSAPHPLPFLDLGDSGTVRPGQWVVAVGNPFGLGGTVTAGIVSASGRDIGAGPYDDFLQVDAPINSGNSGGPLFTQDGKVVGVNTAILSPSGGSIGIGFAIPSNLVRSVVAQLESTGHVTRGFLGVQTQPVSDAMAAALRLNGDKHGALVAGVEPNSPAAQAGLREGDVVRAVNGKPVAGPRQLAQLVAAVAPGSSVSLDIVRDGAARSLSATVSAQPDEAVAENGAGPSQPGQPTIGVALVPLSPELRDQLELPQRLNGAVVAEVQPGSPAEAAGLRRGDLLTGVGSQPVSGPEDAVRAIRAASKDGKGVALRIVRDGRPRFVAVTPTGGSSAG